MIITVGTQPDPRDRVRMRLSADDGEAVLDLDRDGIIEVADLDTGAVRILRRADCGLGCRCAVEFADTNEDGYVVDAPPHSCIEYARFDIDPRYPYCAVCGTVLERAGDALVVPGEACEGYNVAGRWVDCARPMPHAHGILAD